MKKNNVIIVRGLSPKGPVSRLYLNIDQQEAQRRFSKNFPVTDSSLIEFDDELQLEGYAKFLQITTIN